MDKFSRRPTVSRFKLKKTFGVRSVKRTLVSKKNVNNFRKNRALKPMRPTRKRR